MGGLIEAIPLRPKGSDKAMMAAGSAPPKVDEEMVAAVPADAVWGNTDGQGANYRSLSWVRGAVLETKIQIGLGVLALPTVLHTMGLVPGILVIAGTGLVSLWAQLNIGLFVQAHPDTYSLGDVGQIWFGPIGREIFGGLTWDPLISKLFFTVIAGAAMIGLSTALNALSNHGACTVVFVVVAAIASGIVAGFQTLEKISWLGWVGVIGILSSVITLAIAVSQQDRPDAAPQVGPWDRDLQIIGHPSFVDAMTSVSTIWLSYAGSPYYLSIVAEFRKPSDYWKSIMLSQSVTVATYLIVSSVVYHYVGQYISSPAPGSAGETMKKVCYGLALVGLLVSCVLNIHIPAKYVFVRIMRRSRHLTDPTWQHWVVWLGCVVTNCTLSFIIAESIPVFGDLVSLAGALLSTPTAYTIPLGMWLWVSRRKLLNRSATWWEYAIAVVDIILIAITLFVMVAGTYANGVTIHRNVKNGAVGGVFSCSDNSNSS